MITYRNQQDLQFLGFFGIFKESFKIIISCKKIFSLITLTLILPSSTALISHVNISQLLYSDILKYKNKLNHTEKNSPNYAKFLSIISSESTAFTIFSALNIAFFLILDILVTSAVIYTTACIYSAIEITFKKIISVSPKVWKRLAITYICSLCIAFSYLIVGGALLLLWVFFVGVGEVSGVIFLLLLIPYVIGFLYLILVYQLACVVSVLEDYGFKAMIKSNELVKGKIIVSICFCVLKELCMLGTEEVFENFAASDINNKLLSIVLRTGVRMLCLFSQFLLGLFGYVVQTVIYFVCKSYHHENIDRNSLAEHLDGFLGGHVPTKAEGVPTGGDSFVVVK
jgi:hypothetical protein